MDLLSLVLSLETGALPAAEAGRELPLWWGRAAHALLLTVVGRQNSVLAEALHEENAPRPFTVSSLIGPPLKNGFRPGQGFFLRLTAIQPEVADLLLAATRPGGDLAPGALVELDYFPFLVQSCAVQPSESPWAAQTTYPELGAPYLTAALTPARQVTLSFVSPVTFKSGGKHVPLPLPDLVFGSLLNQWNTFAPIAFPEDLRRYAQECLAISRYKLSSRVVPLKAQSRRMGGVGEITFATLNYDRYWMSLVHTLAGFALFAGVGAGTAMGLGQCRKIPGD